MIATRKTKGLTGLDMEAGSVAAARVEVNGTPRVVASAIQPLGAGIFSEGEVSDVGALSEALKELFAGAGSLPKTVRVGIANHRVAVRTLRLPMIERPDELDTAIRFQAQDHIPMPLDQTVMQHRVVGYVTGPDGQRQIDVVVVAARRDMIATVLEATRKAGLRPMGIDLSAFGMIRALNREPALVTEVPAAHEQPSPSAEDSDDSPQPDGQHRPVRLYCNFGDVTNLAVARGDACEFTRISPFGIEGVAQRLAEKRALTLEHARQWLVHVGLERATEEIDGDPEIVAAGREVLSEGVAKFADELRLSLEFYGAQEGAGTVEAVVACGPGTTIPGLVERLQRELGLRFEVGRPTALAGLDDASAARLTLPYGLALEE
jgi:type IV pilus assembly protein PilM